MESSKSFVIMCLLICLTVAKCQNKEAIGFPEAEEDPKLVNKDNRLPVFLPAQCPVNELYYPGDQKDDWICDCRPAYLYHPNTNQCWPALKRGPCAEGQHLVLPSDSAIPVCEKNPCGVDGMVMFQGKCSSLGTPCGGNVWPRTTEVAVNAVDLTVHCAPVVKPESRFGTEILPTLPTLETCPPGARRSISGKCLPPQ